MPEKEFGKKAQEGLREAYRQEEFKRSSTMIEICNKTEDLILLTYKLFNKLRGIIKAS